MHASRKIRFRLGLLLIAFATTAAAQPPSLEQARQALAEGRLPEALAAIEQLLEADRGNRNARFLHGVVLAETGDSEAAIAAFSALTRDHPELPEPHNNLAVLYAARGDYDRARDALLQAINTHPSYATAHENLGDIYAKMASVAYERALEFDGGNDAAKRKLALIDDLFSDTAVARTPMRVPAPVGEPTPPAPGTALAIEAPASRAVPKHEPEVAAAIRRWAEAWSAQDVDAYLAAYAPGTSPRPGLDRDRWERERRTRLLQPRSIRVTVDELRVQHRRDDRVDVTFVQRYRSDTYQDRVRKRLSLQRDAEGWKIVHEQTLSKL